MPIVSLGNSVPLIQWLNCDKVVVYQNMKSKYFDMINWGEYVSENQHVKFIFIIEAKDEALIEQFIHFNHLENYSVFWDKDGAFIKNNNLESEITFISFIVDKEDKIIKLSNPSLPGFSKLLTNLEGC